MKRQNGLRTLCKGTQRNTFSINKLSAQILCCLCYEMAAVRTKNWLRFTANRQITSQDWTYSSRLREMKYIVPPDDDIMVQRFRSLHGIGINRFFISKLHCIVRLREGRFVGISQICFSDLKSWVNIWRRCLDDQKRSCKDIFGIGNEIWQRSVRYCWVTDGDDVRGIEI